MHFYPHGQPQFTQQELHATTVTRSTVPTDRRNVNHSLCDVRIWV